MSKTPLIAALVGVPLLTWAAAPVVTGVRAAEQVAPRQVASHPLAPDQVAPGGLNALDGRRFASPSGAPAEDEGAGFAADPPAFWNPGVNGGERESADGAGGSGADLGAFGGAPAQAPDALPLSQFAGARAAAPVRPGVWDFFNRVRYGGLPEPASWALIVIGFGMIGGAVRGFVVANRRLARLQPEDPDPE